MSFGIGIGDIVLLSNLAHSIGKAITSGRKGAPAEFQEVQNQLFAISKALSFLSAAHKQSSVSDFDEVTPEDEILGRMIKNCGVTLRHLDEILKNYPELRAGSERREVDEKFHQKWKQDLKDNIKKIKWTTEGQGLDKLIHDLGTHVNALNLAITSRN